MTMFRFHGRTVVEGDVTSEASSSEGVDILNHLKHFEYRQHLDPNLPTDEIELIEAPHPHDDTEKAVMAETVSGEDNSPYPEVCSFLCLLLYVCV